MPDAATIAKKQERSKPAGDDQPRRSPWIIGPWADTTLIIGSPLIIYLLLVSARFVWSAAAISSFVMIWAIGHHLPGMMRAYGDPTLFRRFRVRFIIAPLLLLAACVFAFTTTMTAGLLSITAVWGWWHYMMQTYGFVRIYDAKVGSFAATTRVLDKAMCFSWFAAAVVLNDNALYGFLQNFYNSGLALPSADFIATLRSIVQALVAAVTVLFAVHAVRGWFIGQRPSLIKFILMGTTFAYFWYSAATVTNIVVAYAFFELFHDVQYLAIVWAFNRNRVAKDGNLGGFTRFLFQPRLLLIGLYIVSIFAYGSLKYGSEQISDESMYRVLAAVFLTSTLLHYYFDGFIWKLRDKSNQSSLDIDGQSNTVWRWSLPMWSRHGLVWLLFLVPFLGLLVTQVTDAQQRHQLEESERLAQRLTESRQLADIAPGSVQAHFTLGLALEANGQFQQAIDAYQGALAIYPNYDAAQRRLRRLGRRLRLGADEVAPSADPPSDHEQLIPGTKHPLQ